MDPHAADFDAFVRGSTAVAVRDARPPTPPPVVPSPTVLPTEGLDGDPDLGPFPSATVTVPSWGAADATCTTGRVTLRDGQYQADAAHRPVNVLSYVAADVDRDGVEDSVAHLMCGEGPEAGGSQIVAFRRSGTDLVPLGRIVGTQDGFAMMNHIEARDGGRIAVLVSEEYTDGGQHLVPNQWRTYAWQDGSFRQVDGPTTFLSQPSATVLSVSASELPFRRVAEGFTGQLTVMVRNDGAVDVARLEVLLILPGEVRPAGEGWAGCTVRPAANQTVLVCAVPGPGARSSVSLPFVFTAAERPVVRDDPVNFGNHVVSIAQLPPFDGQVMIIESPAVIPITVS